MKVNIGPYVGWFGPYQLAEKILFWKDKHRVNETNPLEEHPDHLAIYKLGDRLADIGWLNSFLNWVYSKQKRKVSVRIDRYDAWSADHTLAMIIHPLLIELKDQKGGSPHVDDEDVPEHLRSYSAPELTEEEKNSGHTDENWHKRWDWVLDEMIWAFEQHANEDWEDQYHSGNHDLSVEDGVLKIGPNDTHKVDREGIKKHRERMSNGRRLFAKYYEGLWS